MGVTRGMTVKLTERGMEGLRPDPEKKVQWTVEGFQGLKVVVSTAGAKRWEFRYSLAGRKYVQAWGQYPAVGIEQIKRKFLDARAMLADGKDPAAEVGRIKRDDMTLAQFALDHFMPYQEQAIKSFAIQRMMLKRILPKYGRKRLRDITRHDVIQLGAATKEDTSAINANRHMSLFARMLSLAAEWGMVQTNVAAGVKHYKETGRHRERYLTPEETTRLDAALAAEGTVGAFALRALLWTGLRRGEVVILRAEDVDAHSDAPSVYLRQTKAGDRRTVPINSMAAKVFRECERFRVPGSPYVFPSHSPRGYIRDLRATWDKCKKIAKIPNPDGLRCHDLRHSFASSLVQGGASLYVVQKLLGHHAPTMTARYAHLADAPLREASESLVSRAAVGAEESR